MTDKDIEKMLESCDGLDMSHVKKDDILAKAKQEMYFNTNTAEDKKKKSSFPLLFAKKRLVPILAGAALALTLFIGMIGLYNENFQTVYIDINPSVALKLNRFERVIDVEFLNDDAKTLLSDTKLVGLNAQNALKTVIEACDSAGYVNDDSEIYISASSKEEKDAEKLLQKLKGHAESMNKEQNETYAVNTYNAKKSEGKDFEKESLSPAKYKLIHEIIDEDGRYELEDLKHKPMNELQKIKHGLDDDDFDDDDDDDDDDRDKKDNHDLNNEHNNGSKPNNKNENENRYDKDDDRDNHDDDRDDDDDDDDDKKRK